MNWFLIILVALASLLLILALIRKNRRDERSLKSKMNRDYHKPRDPDVNDPNVR
jgi:hypothetical protein